MTNVEDMAAMAIEENEQKMHAIIFQEAIKSGAHDKVYDGHGVHMATDIQEAYAGIQALLRLSGEIDHNREGIIETPKRFIKAFLELTGGALEDPKVHLEKNFSIADSDPEVPNYDEVIISGGIPFNSLCEHHLLPFSGTIDIGYIPNPLNGRIVGLSKLARMADGYARRLQVQERLAVQIEHAIDTVLHPLGAAVIIRGKHTCQCMRGIKKDGYMVTSRMTGVFRDKPEARMEFLQLLEQK